MVAREGATRVSEECGGGIRRMRRGSVRRMRRGPGVSNDGRAPMCAHGGPVRARAHMGLLELVRTSVHESGRLCCRGTGRRQGHGAGALAARTSSRPVHESGRLCDLHDARGADRLGAGIPVHESGRLRGRGQPTGSFVHESPGLRSRGRHPGLSVMVWLSDAL